VLLHLRATWKPTALRGRQASTEGLLREHNPGREGVGGVGLQAELVQRNYLLSRNLMGVWRDTGQSADKIDKKKSALN
jgi:hypothetical protein